MRQEEELLLGAPELRVGLAEVGNPCRNTSTLVSVGLEAEEVLAFGLTGQEAPKLLANHITYSIIKRMKRKK